MNNRNTENTKTMRIGVIGLCFGVALSMSVAFCTQPPAVQWTRTFTGIYRAFGDCVLQVRDGGYIIAGSTISANSNQVSYLLIKTDSAGAVVWQRVDTVVRGSGARSILQTADGGYVFVGGGWVGTTSGAYLAEVDSSGNLRWESIVDSQAEGYSLVQTEDRGYAVTAQNPMSDIGASLIRCDSLGHRRWEVRYAGFCGYSAINIPLLRASDGGYVIGGHAIIRADSLGNKEWVSEGSGVSLVQANDGGFVVTGVHGTSSRPKQPSLYLLKMDSVGNVLWSRDFEPAGRGDGHCVAKTDDGGYLIGGGIWSYEDATAPPYLVKADSIGAVEWDMTLDGEGEVGCVSQTSDGGFIVVGSRSGVSSGDHDHVFLTKLAPQEQR